MTVVDAHQHFWDPARVSYPWLASHYPELDRNFGFDDLAPQLHANGVDATVVVQSEDDDADNELMVEIALCHDEIAGVVAWAPLDDPFALEKAIERLRRSGKLVGVRVLIHNRPDLDWIVRPEVQEGLEVLEHQGLTFDMVAVQARHLEHVPVLAELHPNLRLVIDHLAKPPIGLDLTAWSELLARAAACPNVFAKVSGLYPAQGDRYPWTVDDLRPAFAIALEAFGVSRLMFGSDWPICEVAGGYNRVAQAQLELADELSDDEREALRGGTAIHCYGLRQT
ncbi:MAG: amidohydrolase family protein [Acidimicrobiales bacterium]